MPSMSSTIEIDGRVVEVRILDETDAAKAALARLTRRASELDELCRAGLARALADEGADGEVNLYLDHHLGELRGLAGELGAGGADASDVGLRRAFLAHLMLCSIWSDGDVDDFAVHFDYSIDPTRTQYVLCVTLDGDGRLRSIAMES
jgi:hypothetical protein